MRCTNPADEYAANTERAEFRRSQPSTQGQTPLPMEEVRTPGVKTIDDMGNKFEKELEEFFVNYHKLTGKEYRVLAMKGPDQARKLVKNGRK